MNEKITLPQLKNLCKDRGIKGYSKLNKKELILLIERTLSVKDENIKNDSDKDDKSVETESSEKVEEPKTIKNKSNKNECTEKVKETKTIKDKSDKDECTEKVKEPEIIKDKSDEKINEINEIMGKTITEHYKLKDDKSDKFWEITYEDINDEKKKYKVRYGKEGTDGIYSKIKEDTFKNIQKIIITKEKKGYARNK